MYMYSFLLISFSFSRFSSFKLKLIKMFIFFPVTKMCLASVNNNNLALE